MEATIELRSDGSTAPTPGMREAMLRAVVGDDRYGEDPTVRALEERVAGLLGKQAALFVASGTMANQIALRVLTRPGDEVVAGGEAHILWHETGAAAALAGVQISAIGTTGVFDADAFRDAVKPRGHMVFPPTGLVVIENTHNRGGGLVFPHHDTIAICAAADALGIATLLDGARLFNAVCVSGLPAGELARPFRLAWIALSKGLGCPAGSVFVGLRHRPHFGSDEYRHRRPARGGSGCGRDGCPCAGGGHPDPTIRATQDQDDDLSWPGPPDMPRGSRDPAWGRRPLTLAESVRTRLRL